MTAFDLALKPDIWAQRNLGESTDVTIAWNLLFKARALEKKDLFSLALETLIKPCNLHGVPKF